MKSLGLYSRHNNADISVVKMESLGLYSRHHSPDKQIYT